VLTPSHVTELFCDLADLKVSDVVYDPCCGTGGFLIAAMKRMVALAGNDNAKKKNIRKNQLVGIEIRPDMFTFACSNMMLRGDGKSNIDCGDCFNDETAESVYKLKPTVAFLNPPYDKGTDDQLQFVERAITAVSPTNGRVVAIVQMSCAIASGKEIGPIKERLLEKHTLKAVISMPDELFSPIGVITCIMVFDANSPNKGKKTWFGYLKDDGFVKRKNTGRIDYYSKWSGIRERFLGAYLNHEEIPGLSVKMEVGAHDEWCAEAYMQTDYSVIKKEDFEIGMKKYVLFKTVGIIETDSGNSDDNEEN
jgi:type I restriction-modification system DNA methylase subunit